MLSTGQEQFFCCFVQSYVTVSNATVQVPATSWGHHDLKPQECLHLGIEAQRPCLE